MLHCTLQIKAAKRLKAEYESMKAELKSVEEKLALLDQKLLSGAAGNEERIEAHDLGRESEELGVRIGNKKDEILYAMNDARVQATAAGRLGDPAVQAALAEHYMDLWREALAAGNTASMESNAEHVREFDPRGFHEPELEGLGALTVDGTEGARVYLFRYESHVAASPNAVAERLVPVPSRGQASEGPYRLAGGFYAGDPCLLVVDGGIADLDPGDLILEVNGRPAAGGLFVERVTPDGPADRAGVGPFHCIVRVEGVERADAFVWENYAPGAVCRVETVFGAQTASFLCTDPGKTLAEQSGLRAAPLERLLADTVAPGTITLRALCGGREKTITIRDGELAGIRSEITACPLVCTEENMVGTIPFRLDDCVPGSYLLLVRADGMEDLRLPVLVPRRRRADTQADLLPAGTAPPGFVRVAAGEFTRGGDREALWSHEKEKLNVGEFWIARGEVTIGEWFEFVNDREVFPEIEKAQRSGKVIYLPRFMEPDTANRLRPAILTLLADTDELTGLWKSLSWDDPVIPAVGMSRQDISEYLDWKNERVRKSGEQWEYFLPSQDEWEKAARGVDRRFYPWGDRFDFTFCKSLYSHSKKLFPKDSLKLRRLERGLSYPIDESVYGVRDLAGSVVEWNRDLYDPHTHSIRGGPFDGGGPELFRAATRDRLKPDETSYNLGFRLIARPLD